MSRLESSFDGSSHEKPDRITGSKSRVTSKDRLMEG